jgi:hypothetical protein
LIVTVATSITTVANAQSARVPLIANPQGARRTYPGLRTLPGVPSTNAIPSAGGSATNVPGSQPLTNNAPVIRVGPNSPTNSTPARPSKVTPLQLENINRLDTDLGGLELPARDPSQQRQVLLNTLKAAPIAQARPTPESISHLAATLANVFPTLRLTPVQRRQLAIDVNMAINSANLSSTEAQRVLADANALLESSRLNHVSGVDQLTGELKDIVSQVQSQVAQNPDSNKTTSQEVGRGGTSQSEAGSGTSPQP